MIGPVAKGVLASFLVAAGGWTAHTLLEAQANQQTLIVHTQQLNKLEQGQDAMTEALQAVKDTVTRIDQKIDDDRRERRQEDRSRR